jgi:hypothetical protein
MERKDLDTHLKNRPAQLQEVKRKGLKIPMNLCHWDYKVHWHRT